MLNDNIIVETGWPNERIIIIIIVISCLFIYIGDNTGMGDPSVVCTLCGGQAEWDVAHLCNK